MKKNIIIMNIITCFFWMSMYTYVPTMPAYAMSIGATAVTLGIIGGVYGISQIIIRVPLGAFSDKTGKSRALMIVGSAILLLSSLIMAIGNTTDSLIVGRLIAGVSAAWWVIMCATYGDYHPEDMQVKAHGTINAANSVGKVIAAFAGGIFAQYIGLKAPFVFAVFTSAVSLIFSFMLKDVPQTTKRPSLKETFMLFKNKELWIFSFFAIISQMLCFGAATMFSQVAAEELGANNFTLGMLTVVFFGSTMIFSFFVGTKPYRKLGGKLCIFISFIAATIACIPYFYHIDIFSIFMMQILFGVCYGISCAALGGFAIRAVQPNQKAGATGIFQSLFAVGIFFGPMIAGFVMDAFGFDMAYIVFLVISAATTLLSALIIPKRYDKM